MSLSAPPAGLRRLFPDHDPEAVLRPEHRNFLVARLLEEGDSADLRWLFAALGAETVRRTLAAAPPGTLTPRSSALWRLVLGVAATPAPDLARELWPFP